MRDVAGEVEDWLVNTPEQVQKLGKVGEGVYSAMQVAMRTLANQVYPNWALSNEGRQVAVASARTMASGMSMADIVASTLRATAVPDVNVSDPRQLIDGIVQSIGRPGSGSAFEVDYRGTITNLRGVTEPDPIKHNLQRIYEHYGKPEGEDIPDLLNETQELFVIRVKAVQLAYRAMLMDAGVIDPTAYAYLIRNGFVIRSVSGQTQIRQMGNMPVNAEDPNSYRTVIANVDTLGTRPGSYSDADYGHVIQPIEEALRLNYIYDVGEDHIRQMGLKAYKLLADKRLSDALEPLAKRNLKTEIGDADKTASATAAWQRTIGKVANNIAEGKRTRHQERDTFDKLRRRGRALGLPETQVDTDVAELEQGFEAWFKTADRARRETFGTNEVLFASAAAKRAADIIDEAVKVGDASANGERSEIQARLNHIEPQLTALEDEIADIQFDSPKRQLLRRQFFAGIEPADPSFVYVPWDADDVEDLDQFKAFLSQQIEDLRSRRTELRAEQRTLQARLEKLPPTINRKPSRAGVAAYKNIVSRLERIAAHVDTRASGNTRFNTIVRDIDVVARDISRLTDLDDADALIGQRFEQFIEDFYERLTGVTEARRHRSRLQNQLDRIVRRAARGLKSVPGHFRDNILNPNPALRESRSKMLAKAIKEQDSLVREYESISLRITGGKNARELLEREEARTALAADELAEYGFDARGNPTDITGLSQRAQADMRAMGISETEIRGLDRDARSTQREEAAARYDRYSIGDVVRRQRRFRSRQTERGRRVRGLREARRRLEPRLKAARERVRELERFVVDYDRVRAIQDELARLKREISDVDFPAIETRALTEESFNLTKNEIEMRYWILDALDSLWNARNATIAAKRGVVDQVNDHIAKTDEILNAEIKRWEDHQEELKLLMEKDRVPDLENKVPSPIPGFSDRYVQLYALDRERYPKMVNDGRFYPEHIKKGVDKEFFNPNPKTLEGIVHATVKGAANVATSFRFLSTSYDFGAMFIQQIVLLANRPDLFAKVVWGQLAQTFDPLYGSRYIANNLDTVLEMARHGSPVNTAQFTEFQAALDPESAGGGEIQYVGGRGLFPAVGERLVTATAEGRGPDELHESRRPRKHPRTPVEIRTRREAHHRVFRQHIQHDRNGGQGRALQGDETELAVGRGRLESVGEVCEQRHRIHRLAG